ncbi:MAG: type II toxin-antitoxin system RelE/ParE family toxin [Asticcacaulis sp.]
MASGYHLSDMALEDIAAIHDYSVTHWGEHKADQYVAAIYHAINRLAISPDRNISRNARSSPFRMIAVEQHFIIYDLTENGTVILTLMHQAQDVEKRVAKLTPTFRQLVAGFSRYS